MNILSTLNQHKDTPVESWPLTLRKQVRAVSMNAHGMASSGTFGPSREYFFRRHEFKDGAFTGKTEFVKG